MIINDLEGSWEATSYILDGIETIGSYESHRFEFNAYDHSEDQGTYGRTSVFALGDGTPLEVSGTYFVIHEGAMIDLL